ncbi:MAG: hypothetical protein ABI389_14960 [Rhodanobacter sp.]
MECLQGLAHADHLARAGLGCKQRLERRKDFHYPLLILDDADVVVRRSVGGVDHSSLLEAGWRTITVPGRIPRVAGNEPAAGRIRSDLDGVAEIQDGAGRSVGFELQVVPFEPGGSEGAIPRDRLPASGQWLAAFSPLLQ